MCQMTHFSTVWNERNNGFFNYVFHLYWRKMETNFWEKNWPVLNYVFHLYWSKINTLYNFHGSLSLNKWKLIWYSGSLWYAIVSIMTHVDDNALFVCIIGKSNVPGKYPAGEFPVSRIFRWIFCWMAFGHLKKLLSVSLSVLDAISPLRHRMFDRTTH